MRTPIRKAEQDRQAMQSNGPIYLTKEAIAHTERRIESIKSDLPHLRQELQDAQAMGDLSENAAYSIAKANLRRAQSTILMLEDRLKRAVEIAGGASDVVSIGSRVTVEVSGEERAFRILGSLESNPIKGIISFESPIGAALIEKRVGEVVEVNGVQYKILKIE